MGKRAKKLPSLVDLLKRLEADAWRALRKHEDAHECVGGSWCPEKWILLSLACEVQARVDAARGKPYRQFASGVELDRLAFEAHVKGWRLDKNGDPVDPRRDERAQEEFELGAVRS